MSNKGLKDSFRRSLTEYIQQLQKKNDWRSCLSLLKGCAETDKDLTFLPYETLIPFLAAEHGRWKDVLALSTRMMPPPLDRMAQGAAQERLNELQDNSKTAGAIADRRVHLSEDGEFLNRILNTKSETARQSTSSASPTADEDQQKTNHRQRAEDTQDPSMTEISTYFAKVGAGASRKGKFSKKKQVQQTESPKATRTQDEMISSVLTVLLEAAMTDSATVEGGSAPFLVQCLKDAFAHNADLPVATLQKCEATLTRWLANPALFTDEVTHPHGTVAPLTDMEALLDVVHAVLRVRTEHDKVARGPLPDANLLNEGQKEEKDGVGDAKTEASLSVSATLDDYVMQKIEDIHMYMEQQSSSTRSRARAASDSPRDPYTTQLADSLRAYVRQSAAKGAPHISTNLSRCIYTIWDCAIRALTNHRCTLAAGANRSGTTVTDHFSVGREAALVACAVLSGSLSEQQSSRHYFALQTVLNGTLFLQYALLTRTPRSFAMVQQWICMEKGKLKAEEAVLLALYENTCQVINSVRAGDQPDTVETDAFWRSSLSLIFDICSKTEMDVRSHGMPESKVGAARTPLLQEMVATLARLIVHHYARQLVQQDGISSAAPDALVANEARLTTLLLLCVEDATSGGEAVCDAAGPSVVWTLLHDVLLSAGPQRVAERRGVCQLLLRVLNTVSKKSGGSIALLFASKSEIDQAVSQIAPSSARKTAPPFSGRSMRVQAALVLAQTMKFASQYATLIRSVAPSLEESDSWASFQTLVQESVKDESTAKHIASCLVLQRLRENCADKKKEGELDAENINALRFFIKALPPPLALAVLSHLLDRGAAFHAQQTSPNHGTLRFLERVSVLCVALQQDSRINLSLEEKNASVRRLLHVPQATANEAEKEHVSAETATDSTMGRRALLLWKENPQGLAQQSELAALLQAVLAVEPDVRGREANGGSQTSRIPSSEGAEHKWLTSNAAMDTILYTLVVKSSPPRWADALAIVRQGVSLGDPHLVPDSDHENSASLASLLRVTGRGGRPLGKSEHEKLVEELKPLLYKRKTNAAIRLFYAYERDGRRLTLSELELFAAAGVSRGPVSFAERVLVYAQGCPSSVRVATSVIRCAAQHYASLGHQRKEENKKRQDLPPRKHTEEATAGKLLSRHRCQVLALRGARLLPKVVPVESNTTDQPRAAVSLQRMTKEDVAVVKKCFLVLTDHNMKDAHNLALEAGLFQTTAVTEGIEALESTLALCTEAGDFRSGVNAYLKFRDEYMRPPVKYELLQQLIRMEVQHQRQQGDEAQPASLPSAKGDVSEADAVTTMFSQGKERRQRQRDANVSDNGFSVGTQTLLLLIQDGYRALLSSNVVRKWELETESGPDGVEEGSGKDANTPTMLLRFFEDTLSAVFEINVDGYGRSAAAASAAAAAAVHIHAGTSLAHFIQQDGVPLFQTLLKPFLAVPKATIMKIRVATVCLQFLRAMSVLVSTETQHAHGDEKDHLFYLLEQLVNTVKEFLATIHFDDVTSSAAKDDFVEDFQQHRINGMWMKVVQKHLGHKRRSSNSLSRDSLDQMVVETEANEFESVKFAIRSYTNLFVGKEHSTPLSSPILCEMHRAISFVLQCGLARHVRASALQRAESAVGNPRRVYRVSSLTALAAAAEVSAELWQQSAAVDKIKASRATTTVLTSQELEGHLQATHVLLSIIKDFFDLHQYYELRFACPGNAADGGAGAGAGGGVSKESDVHFAVRAALKTLHTAVSRSLHQFQQGVWLPFWLETSHTMRVCQQQQDNCLTEEDEEGGNVWYVVFKSEEWRREWLVQQSLLALCASWSRHPDLVVSGILLLSQKAERAIRERETVVSNKEQLQRIQQDALFVATILFFCDASLSADSFLHIHGRAVKALLLSVVDSPSEKEKMRVLSSLDEQLCGLLFANPRLEVSALQQLMAPAITDKDSVQSCPLLSVSLCAAWLRWCHDVPAFIRKNILTHQNSDAVDMIRSLLSHLSNDWGSVFWSRGVNEEGSTKYTLYEAGLVPDKRVLLHERSVYVLLFLWHHIATHMDNTVTGCFSWVEESVLHTIQLVALMVPDAWALVELITVCAPIRTGEVNGALTERLLTALQNVVFWPPAKLLTWSSFLMQHGDATNDEKKKEEVRKLLEIVIKENYAKTHKQQPTAIALAQEELIEADILSREDIKTSPSTKSVYPVNMYDYKCKKALTACVARAAGRWVKDLDTKNDAVALFRGMDCALQLEFLLQMKRSGANECWTRQQMMTFFELADPSVQHLSLLDRFPFLKDMSLDAAYNPSTIAEVWQTPAAVQWSSRRHRYTVMESQELKAGDGVEMPLAFPGALFSTYHAFQHLLGKTVETKMEQPRKGNTSAKKATTTTATTTHRHEMGRLLRLPPLQTEESAVPLREAGTTHLLGQQHVPKLLHLERGDAAFTAAQVLCQTLGTTAANWNYLHDQSANHTISAVQRLAWGCATASSSSELATFLEEEIARTPSALLSLEWAHLLWNVILHRLVELERYETVVKRRETTFQQNELRAVISYLALVERGGGAPSVALGVIQKEILLYGICLLLRKVASPQTLAHLGAEVKKKEHQLGRMQQEVKVFLHGLRGKEYAANGPYALSELLKREQLCAWMEAVDAIHGSILCCSTSSGDTHMSNGDPSSFRLPFAWKHSPWPPLLLEERLFSIFQSQWETFFSNPSKQLLPPSTIHFEHPTMVCRVLDMIQNGSGRESGFTVALQHALQTAHPLLQMANATKEYVVHKGTTFVAAHPSVKQLMEEVHMSSLPTAVVRRATEKEEEGSRDGDHQLASGVGGGGAGSALVLDHFIRILRASNGESGGLSPEFVSVTRELIRDVFNFPPQPEDGTRNHLYRGYVPLEWNHLLHLFIMRVGFERQKTAVVEHVEMVLCKLKGVIASEDYLLSKRYAGGLEDVKNPTRKQESSWIHCLRKGLLSKKDVQQLLCFFLKSHHVALTFVNPHGWHAQRAAVADTTYTCLLEFLYQLHGLEVRAGVDAVNYWSPNVQSYLDKLFSSDTSDALALSSGPHRAPSESVPMALLRLSSPYGGRQKSGEVHLRSLLLFFSGAWRTSFSSAAAHGQNATIVELLRLSKAALAKDVHEKKESDPLEQILRLLHSMLTIDGAAPPYHLLTRLLDHAVQAVQEPPLQSKSWPLIHGRWGLRLFARFAPYTRVTSDMIEQVLLLLWRSSPWLQEETDRALFQDVLYSVLQNFQSVRLTPLGVTCVILLYAKCEQQKGAPPKDLLLWRAVNEMHRMNEVERASMVALVHTYSCTGNKEKEKTGQEVFSYLLNGCTEFLLRHPHYDMASDQMFLAVADRLYRLPVVQAHHADDKKVQHACFVQEILEQLMLQKDEVGNASSTTPWRRIMLFYQMYKEDAALRISARAEDARFDLRVLNYLLQRDRAHQRQTSVTRGGPTTDAFCGWQEALRVLSPFLTKGKGDAVLATYGNDKLLLGETASKTLDALCLAQSPQCWKEALLLCTSLAQEPTPAAHGSVSSLTAPRAPSIYGAMQYFLNQQDLCALPLNVSTTMLSTLYAVEQRESTCFRTFSEQKRKNRLNLLQTFCLTIVNHPFLALPIAKDVSKQLRYLENALHGRSSDSSEGSIVEAFSEKYVKRLCGSCLYEDALYAAISLPLSKSAENLVPLVKQAAAYVAPSHIDAVMHLVREAMSARTHEDPETYTRELASLLNLEKPHVNDQLDHEFTQSLLSGQTQKAAEMCRRCLSLLNSNALLQQPPKAKPTSHGRRENRLHFRIVSSFFTALVRSSRTAAAAAPSSQPRTSSAAFQWSSLSIAQLAWIVECYQQSIRTHFTATPSQQRHLHATVMAALDANLALWSAVLDQKEAVDAGRELLPQLLVISEWMTEYVFSCRPLDANSVFSVPWMRMYANRDAPQLAVLLKMIETQLLPAIGQQLQASPPEQESKADRTPHQPWLRVKGMEEQWRRLVLVAAAASQASISLQLAASLSQLAQQDGTASTSLFAPHEMEFLRQVQEGWMMERSTVEELAQKREAESVLQWRDAAYQRGECPPLVLCLVMIESISLLRSTSAGGASVSPLTGIRMSVLIRFSESLAAVQSIGFFTEGARQFLSLLASEEANRGVNVVLSFSWIEAARLFVTATIRLVKRMHSNCTDKEEGNNSRSSSYHASSAARAQQLMRTSQLASEVHRQWQAMRESRAAEDARMGMAVNSAYEQAFCLELMQLLAYTQPVTWQRPLQVEAAASHAQREDEMCSLDAGRRFVALIEQYTSQPSTLTREKCAALYACLEAFLDRSYTCMASAAETFAACTKEKERNDGHQVITRFCEESLQLTLEVWQRVNAARHEIEQYGTAAHRAPSTGDAGILKCQERIVCLLLQIQALQATQSQDPCPSFRHVLTTMRSSLPVHLNDDAKALLKVNCIHFHKANWKKMYADITNTSPRLTTRETVLTSDEEATEQQRLSRALLTAPSCEAAWALCQVKRETGVRLSKEHYKEVLRLLQREEALDAASEHRKHRKAFTALSSKWQLVEEVFFALLRDGVTPDVSIIERIFKILGSVQVEDDISEKQSSALNCLYFAKMLTLLPPITNVRHAGKRSRTERQSKVSSLEQEPSDETGKGDYMLTASILSSVFSPCQYVTQTLLGRKYDEGEGEEALRNLQDICELAASFTTWINGFSRLPRISDETVGHIVFLLCNSFCLKSESNNGVYTIVPQGASELMHSAFVVVNRGQQSLFADRRATCVENRPHHAKAALLCVLKQKQLHRVMPSFPSLALLCSATMALGEASRHTLQQLAALVKDPVAVTPAERATLALQVAEQSLWGLATGQQEQQNFVSPAEVRVCAESAYAATLALFTPDSSKLYNDMIMDESTKPSTEIEDGEDGEGALSPDARQIESHIDSMMQDVAGELRSPATITTGQQLLLPPALLASISSLNELIVRTEPTADFNMALRHVVRELCRCQSWGDVAAWLEAALPTPWPLQQQGGGHVAAVAPPLSIAMHAAEHGPADPAAVATHTVVDDFLLLDIYTALLRAGKERENGTAPTSLQLLEKDSSKRSSGLSTWTADAKLLHKIVKDALFSRGKSNASIIHEAIRFGSL